jgi:hypothetical protein
MMHMCPAERQLRKERINSIKHRVHNFDLNRVKVLKDYYDLRDKAKRRAK